MLRTRAGIEAETRLFAADQEGERREGERKSGTTIAARSHYYMRSTRDAAGRASARLSGRKLKRKQRCLARHRDPCPYPAQIKPTVAFSSVPHSVLFQIPPRPQFSSRPQPTTASVLSRVLVVAQHKAAQEHRSRRPRARPPRSRPPRRPPPRTSITSLSAVTTAPHDSHPFLSRSTSPSVLRSRKRVHH